MKLSEAQEAVDLGKRRAQIKRAVATASSDDCLAIPTSGGGIASEYLSFGGDAEMRIAVRAAVNKVWADRLAVIEARLIELGVEVPE